MSMVYLERALCKFGDIGHGEKVTKTGCLKQ